jgi:cysteine desulfurase
MNIYLDNAATTRTDPKVVKSMIPYFIKDYGNASSLHKLGINAKMALESARKTIAKSINAKPEEIIFTSGATESNNLALKGIAFSKKKGHIITTKIEHDCILNTCKWLKTLGFKITYLNVDKEGFINLKELEDAIKKNKDTILISIIHANNEIGTIQDLEAIGKICFKHNIPFHTDAAQSYTKTLIDVKKQNLSLVSLNSHKIHGPKGVGALYIKKGVKIVPLAHGGGHEQNLRSGTENIPGIIGFAKAVKLSSKKYIKHMAKLRDYLIKEVLKKIPDVKLNGSTENKRLCNNINFSFKYIEGEAIGALLDAKGISSSTGSACSSKSLEPSHVLLALGLTPEQAHGSLRLSLSRYTTKQEIDYTIKSLISEVKKLRRISPLIDKLKI